MADITSNSRTTAVLLRPRYPYGKPQVWFPTDLYKVAAMLERGEIETDIVDLNLEKISDSLETYDFIGIGVIGAPYIPETRRLAQEVKERTGKRPLIGGPGVQYLTEEEFRRLYGDSIQIRNNRDLTQAVGAEIPDVFQISIGERIRNADPDRLERYLGSEFSFFVSQGCKYSCCFCAASRTRDGSRVSEQFSQTVEEDLDAICEKAAGLGLKKMDLYLTSLDLFQNPDSFRKVLETFATRRQRYSIGFRLRGLSRIDSFLQALEQDSEFYEIIPASGLKIVGFGVDGTTEEIWKSQHKGNRSLSHADKAFELCNRLGITPEALMVMDFMIQMEIQLIIQKV